MDQVKVGSYLKKLRNEKKLTQEDLAGQLNVSNRTVSRWETGSNVPGIGILVEIAEFKQVPSSVIRQFTIRSIRIN
ncbi:MAG: helix-turn-helix domain-containing protein [Clostridia bacterium]|jgi:transcriptional regulator with XRE-family HTH domain